LGLVEAFRSEPDYLAGALRYIAAREDDAYLAV